MQCITRCILLYSFAYCVLYKIRQRWGTKAKMFNGWSSIQNTMVHIYLHGFFSPSWLDCWDNQNGSLSAGFRGSQHWLSHSSQARLTFKKKKSQMSFFAKVKSTERCLHWAVAVLSVGTSWLYLLWKISTRICLSPLPSPGAWIMATSIVLWRHWDTGLTYL